MIPWLPCCRCWPLRWPPAGVVLCETEREADLPEQAGALTLVKQYNYGKIKVSRYERGEEV